MKGELHYAMDADLFLAMAKRYPFLHLPLDIGYSVYHEDCKTRGKRAESVAELAMVQARHGGFEEAERTLEILVKLYNEADERASQQPDRASYDTGNYGVLLRRMSAYEKELEKSRRLLLGQRQSQVA